MTICSLLIRKVEAKLNNVQQYDESHHNYVLNRNTADISSITYNNRGSVQTH